MTTRIEIMVMIVLAFSATNAFAIPTAPTITSGSGTITVDANGAYVIDCPSGCGIDSYTGMAAGGVGIGLPPILNTGAQVYSGSALILGGIAFGATDGTITNAGYSANGGTLVVGNYVAGNVATLTTTGATASTGDISITGATSTFPEVTMPTYAGSIFGTPIAVTNEMLTSWNGTTLVNTGTFVFVGSTGGLTGVQANSIITATNVSSAGGSHSIGNGVFLSTTAQGTVAATLGPGGPVLPAANIAADPTNFSAWLNNNALVTNTQVDSIGTLIRSGLNSVLTGSHHRILLDNGMTNSGTGVWVTGDFARHDQSNTDASIGEFGVYKDVTPNLRLGAGVGVNQARQGLPLNGKGKLDSRYLVLESDYRAIDSGWTGSATVVYLGSNRTTISRGYMVGIAPNLSTGDADGSSWAIRLRSDWSNVAALQEWNLSPYLAYTHAESRLDGYTETGGTLPVAFAAQKQISDELRVGVTLLSQLSKQTDLRFPLELALRSNGSTMVTGVAAATPFLFVNAGNTQDWGRAGIELDHRLDNQTVLNGAALFASSGGDSTWLATIGLRHAF